MSMSQLDSDDDDGLMNEINMTPLVDVMLVLLIIFLVTIPVMNNAIKVDLPRASSQPLDQKPAFVDVAVQADGTVVWDKTPVNDAALDLRIAEAAKREPQPELRLRADRAVRYERVAQVMAAAQQGGLSKIGFVTEPRSK
ncbi:biopolymer transporter ExbD [Robbsia sp. Bb-Pol-6]|uniref:Biopolymer transporter ExbD n=1 Tax=Robbsia betulipollinis TaxID=2981849 RepID=A0ABT3ZMU9_9BURK|nr:biopolymer transporter ExbD [Robbsia betulipollinis]MCY0387792.1 biopolymer transporter ExbD [Robbsia betulipollinis]